MPRSIARARPRRWPVALVAIGLAALAIGGLRELVNSSTYQLFGDYVARLDIADRVVALTFDDGPDPVQTPLMLDLLDRHAVKATFFMMGRNVERHPEIVRQVLARGHEIGNHSYSHPKMIFMWPWAVRDEIARTDRALRDAGVTGEILFRPPHAVKFVVLPYVLSEMHKTSVLGDVDPEEWKRPGAAVMAASVLKQTRPGSILGFHDPMGEDTRRAVDAVLTKLVADGYRFETMSVFLKRRGPPSAAPSAARR